MVLRLQGRSLPVESQAGVYPSFSFFGFLERVLECAEPSFRLLYLFLDLSNLVVRFRDSY